MLKRETERLILMLVISSLIYVVLFKSAAIIKSINLGELAVQIISTVVSVMLGAFVSMFFNSKQQEEQRRDSLRLSIYQADLPTIVELKKIYSQMSLTNICIRREQLRYSNFANTPENLLRNYINNMSDIYKTASGLLDSSKREELTAIAENLKNSFYELQKRAQGIDSENHINETEESKEKTMNEFNAGVYKLKSQFKRIDTMLSDISIL